MPCVSRSAFSAAHRDAFAALFVKLLADNALWTASATLVRIEAKRTVDLSPAVSLPAELSFLDTTALAHMLYDSRNEVVMLILATPVGTDALGVRFDDPAFWLESPAI